MRTTYLLIKAQDGLIGPASKQMEVYSFSSFDDAFRKMSELVDEDGGGYCDYFFRNGYSDGEELYAYEIIEVQEG